MTKSVPGGLSDNHYPWAFENNFKKDFYISIYECCSKGEMSPCTCLFSCFQVLHLQGFSMSIHFSPTYTINSWVFLCHEFLKLQQGQHLSSCWMNCIFCFYKYSGAQKMNSKDFRNTLTFVSNIFT